MPMMNSGAAPLLFWPALMALSMIIGVAGLAIWLVKQRPAPRPPEDPLTTAQNHYVAGSITKEELEHTVESVLRHDSGRV